MSEARPEDILGNESYQGNNLPAKRPVTNSSAKIDESVSSVAEKVEYWQNYINYWRKTITQNESVIIIFCILFGLVYSYAINECTGNLGFPVYAYVLVGFIVAALSLLLIADGSLPLTVLVKFAVSVAFGHILMMNIIAVDGHTFRVLSTYVCRYPLTPDSIMVYIFGGGSGYLLAKFEEIRAVGKG
ncbi:hypothetical protein KAR91_60590 [Candidatus Pacearchaeota archaeon]|nr:hypothetical protein [Candidatus Pacearchaeota archaeon]